MNEEKEEKTIEEEFKSLEDEKITVEDLTVDNSAAKITAKRGRIIKKIKGLIKKLEKQENLTEEQKEILENLKQSLDGELYKHKLQLKDRYNKEFIHGSAKLKGIVTTLPKGIGIQCKRILNTIDELKSAKTMREKFKKSMTVLKDAGVLLATTPIFVGKFAIEHWYVVLFLISLIPDILEYVGKFGKGALLFLWRILKRLGDIFFNKKNKDDDKKDDDKKDDKGDEKTALEPELEPSSDVVSELAPSPALSESHVIEPSTISDSAVSSPKIPVNKPLSSTKDRIQDDYHSDMNLDSILSVVAGAAGLTAAGFGAKAVTKLLGGGGISTSPAFSVAGGGAGGPFFFDLSGDSRIK